MSLGSLGHYLEAGESEALWWAPRSGRSTRAGTAAGAAGRDQLAAPNPGAGDGASHPARLAGGCSNWP